MRQFYTTLIYVDIFSNMWLNSCIITSSRLSLSDPLVFCVALGCHMTFGKSRMRPVNTEYAN